MQSTERKILRIVLFVVVFAVMFVLEARHVTRNSGQAYSPSTLMVVKDL
jgi:hypothetical protein